MTGEDEALTTRNRRTHKKSRNGCEPCKRRHAKCDEEKPVCAQCRLKAAPDQCVYVEPQRGKPRGRAARKRHLNQVQLESTASPSTTTPIATHSENAPSIGTPEAPYESSRSPGDFHVNVVHMQLFHLVSNDSGLRALGDAPREAYSRTMQLALEHPFLLHALLSLAALWMAKLRPAEKKTWLVRGVGLQSTALSMFNAQEMPEGPARLAALMFSAMMGQHVLSRVLTASAQDFDTVIDGFAEFLHLQLGIKAVLDNQWDVIRETEGFREILLRFSTAVEAKSGQDMQSELMVLYEMIEVSRLSEDCKSEYRTAIKGLHTCFLGDKAGCEDAIFAWPTMQAKNFANEYHVRRPEALVILAHFAVLIHWHRDSWLFDDKGRMVIELISQHLGKSWAPWLSFPLSEIRDG